MKITFVLSTLEQVGGVRVVFEYANRLQKRNHQVSIVYPVVNLPFLKRASFGELVGWFLTNVARHIKQISRGGHPQPFETASPLIKIPVLSSRFVKSAEKTIPDADVVVATSWETAYTVGQLHAKKGRKFYFVQNYEIGHAWSDGHCWSEAKRLKRNDETCALAMADVTPKKRRLKATKEAVDRSYRLPLRKITISEWLRRLIEDKFGQHVDAIIPNGVNFDIFFEEENGRHDSAPLNVLMPYRRDKAKGFSDGLEALALVRKRHPNARLSVFGKRTPLSFGKLPRLPEWIQFHDRKSDAQLRTLYNGTHIFVSPSWIEGFGLPAMEAMACGCAVVTTDAGGFSDDLKDGENALVVPIRNPGALARGVCRLIEDNDKREKVAENGYRYVQQFTWERATDKLEAILLNES